MYIPLWLILICLCLFSPLFRAWVIIGIAACVGLALIIGVIVGAYFFYEWAIALTDLKLKFAVALAVLTGLCMLGTYIYIHFAPVKVDE